MDQNDRLAIERRLSTLEESVHHAAADISRELAALTAQIQTQNGRVRRNEDWRHTHEQDHETTRRIRNRDLVVIGLVLSFVGTIAGIAGILVGAVMS